jgi:hypothetical protein
MRTKRHRRIPIPQHEFGFTVDTFRLFSETGFDGERMTRELAEIQEARQAANAAQPKLFEATTAAK